jgi:hypothetical protein
MESLNGSPFTYEHYTVSLSGIEDNCPLLKWSGAGRRAAPAPVITLRYRYFNPLGGRKGGREKLTASCRRKNCVGGSGVSAQ